MHWRNIILGLQ